MPHAPELAHPELGRIVARALSPVIEEPEVVIVDSHRVACDGDGGALGHPRVWLEMGEAHSVDCSYCDRRFVLGAHAGPEDPRRDPGDYEGSGGI